MSTLGLAIPLLDEADGCAREAGALAAALDAAGIRFRLMLVDNGSRDGTGEIVDRLARDLPGVRALHLRENAGYGGGILAGLAALDTPWRGWHWGDGQVRPEVVVAACERLARGDVAFVKARRLQREDGWQRRLISAAYNRVACPALGVPVPDVNGCPKIFTAEALARLAPRSRDWLLDLEVVYGAVRANLPWAEVPAVMHRRQGGASKVRLATVTEFMRGMTQARLGRPPWGND